jgi:TPR repeat protein
MKTVKYFTRSRKENTKKDALRCILRSHKNKMSLAPPQQKDAIYFYVRGFQFEHGLGVERDLNEAFKSYGQSASSDYSDAMYTCGTIFSRENLH